MKEYKGAQKTKPTREMNPTKERGSNYRTYRVVTKKIFEIEAQRETQYLTRDQTSLGSLSSPQNTLLLRSPQRTQKIAHMAHPHEP